MWKNTQLLGVRQIPLSLKDLLVIIETSDTRCCKTQQEVKIRFLVSILQTQACVTNNCRALLSGFESSLKKHIREFSLSQSICYSIKKSTISSAYQCYKPYNCIYFNWGKVKTSTCLNSHLLPLEWQHFALEHITCPQNAEQMRE